jgi:RNA polymerase sigma factor (TIGR02999 family)
MKGVEMQTVRWSAARRAANEQRLFEKDSYVTERPEFFKNDDGEEFDNQLAFIAPQLRSDDMKGDGTVRLAAVNECEGTAPEKLLVLVYDELRRLAASKLAHEAPGQTLQPTALVHEAWLRLVGDRNPAFNDRTHFFRAAAEAMRRILIDRARRKKTQRHGGDFERVDFQFGEFAFTAPDVDAQLLAIHDALEKFAVEHPVQAELVKLRYFAGLTNEEVAEVLGVSLSTVKNYWAFSRAWLLSEIENERK